MAGVTGNPAPWPMDVCNFWADKDFRTSSYTAVEFSSALAHTARNTLSSAVDHLNGSARTQTQHEPFSTTSMLFLMHGAPRPARGLGSTTA